MKFTIGGAAIDMPILNLKAQRVILREMPAALADWSTSKNPDALFGVFLKIFATRALTAPAFPAFVDAKDPTVGVVLSNPHRSFDERVAAAVGFLEDHIEGQAEGMVFFDAMFGWLKESGFQMGEIGAAAGDLLETLTPPTSRETPSSIDSSVNSSEKGPTEETGT